MNQQVLFDRPRDEWHENERELKYCGSALNKFVRLNCTRQMTAINIDLIIQKISHKKLRMIESKNKNESMNKGQHNLFCGFLPKVFDFLNSHKLFGYSFEIYLVIGTWPYDTATEVHDLIAKQTKSIDKDGLIKFFNVESEFKDLNNTDRRE